MKLAQRILEEADEVDFDSADVSRLWAYIKNKVDRKAPAKQAELYEMLTSKCMGLIKEMPSGETKLRTLLKTIKSEL